MPIHSPGNTHCCWPTTDPQPTAKKPLPGSFTTLESKKVCIKKTYYVFKTYLNLSVMQQASLLRVS